MLAGEWDVYSNGVHSIPTFLPAGTFTHTLLGEVQGYWCHWSLRQASECSVIQFDLAGATSLSPPSGPSSQSWSPPDSSSTSSPATSPAAGTTLKLDASTRRAKKSYS
jgi:hypothetical protein